jgi:hypothetical protein
MTQRWFMNDPANVQGLQQELQISKIKLLALNEGFWFVVGRNLLLTIGLVSTSAGNELITEIR